MNRDGGKTGRCSIPTIHCNAIDIHYQVSGSGPAVLLLHGNSVDLHSLTPWRKSYKRPTLCTVWTAVATEKAKKRAKSITTYCSVYQLPATADRAAEKEKVLSGGLWYGDVTHAEV